jgi:PAS domain S-box-containing protein
VDLPGEGLLAAIVQSSDHAIFAADLDGMILSWNPAAERMFGFTQDEASGKSIAVLISPESRDEHRRILVSVKKGECVEHYETAPITKSGSRINVSVTLSPVRDSTGGIVGILGIIRDFIERTRADHIFRRRVNFRRLLIDLSRTFIGLSKEEASANMASGLAQIGEFFQMDRVTLLRFSRERAEMTVACTWSAPGVPSPPQVITKKNQPWWVGQVLRGEVSLMSHLDELPEEASLEKAYLRQNGVLSAASIPLRAGGEIGGVIAFATVNRHVSWTKDLVDELMALGDILWIALNRRHTLLALRAALESAKRALRANEALRASEDRYRGLAEQIVDGIFVTDADGRALDANRNACDLLGYTLDELKRLTVEDVVPAGVLPKIREMRRSLLTGQVMRDEWPFTRKDGSVFAGEVVGRRLSDGRFQAVVRDVTERRQAEELQRRLHEVALLLLQKTDMGHVLERIVEAAIAVADADFGNIQLLDEDSSHLRIAAHCGFPQWWLDYWQNVSMGDGRGGNALALGRRIIVEDVEQNPIFSGADLDIQRRAGVRALQSTPLVSKSGRPIGMLSTHYKTTRRPAERTLQLLDTLAREAADIVEHAQVETALMRQAALLDLAPNCIFVRDREGRVTYWNEGAVRCYGWSKEEAIGRIAHVLLGTEFPESADRIVDIVQRTGHWEGELLQTSRDGRRITVDSRWAIERRGPDDRFNILEVNSDITARKHAEEALRESEQRLQSYIDQAGDAIYVLDAESGRILNANTRATQMLGYSRDELLQLFATDIERSQTATEIKDVHERAKQNVMEIEGVHRRKDGSTFPVEIRLTSLGPMLPHRRLAIVRDISERARIERERAEEARRKDEFLALLGHELRNPLAAIHTAIQVLSRGPTLAQRDRMEAMIGRQTTMMRRLVDDLLELERITHGHIDLKLEPMDLAACLSQAAAVLQSTVSDRHQLLLLRLPAEPVRFMADSTRLEQIVSNLLTNASKYTPRGGKIELSGAREASDVVIRCKDNGQGIVPEHRQKIFVPFSRGPKTELGYGEASVGLGLALVKQVTELHGGTVSVDSGGPGLGSEFTVRLPLIPPPSVQEGAAQREPGRASHRPRTIVIVEDNPSVAGALQAALEQEGHSVHLFADGPSALAGVSSLRPDAVLIDIGLPGMDGYEVAARLRHTISTRGVLLIAISGFKRRDRAEGGDDFDRYFNKPVDLPVLLALLDER